MELCGPLCLLMVFFFFFNHIALQFRRISSFSAPSISLILSLAVFNFLFIYLLDFKFQHCIFHFHLVFFQRFLFSDFSFFLALRVPFIPSYESFVVFFFNCVVCNLFILSTSSMVAKNILLKSKMFWKSALIGDDEV